MHLQLFHQQLQVCCLPGLLTLCLGSSVMKFHLILSTDLLPCSVVVLSSQRLRTNHPLFCMKALLSGAFWIFPGPSHPFLSIHPPKACFCFLHHPRNFLWTNSLWWIQSTEQHSRLGKGSHLHSLESSTTPSPGHSASVISPLDSTFLIVKGG